MFNAVPSESEFWSAAFDTRIELEQWAEQNRQILASRRSLEGQLEGSLQAVRENTLAGFCWVCRKRSRFAYGRPPAGQDQVNWRESLACIGAETSALTRFVFRHRAIGCGLNNRQRLSVHVLDHVAGGLSSASVYLTEQLSPVAAALQSRCSRLEYSEFLGAQMRGGTFDARGVRHEDLTRLSFAESTFDAVLSFDVFEHIADYRQALREVRRVLKPGGFFLVSVPFALISDTNVVRAVVRDNGIIEHRLPPEYHGDPVNPEHGVLCYYHFGWEFLQDMRDAGFSGATLRLSWSTDFAYIGHESPLIIATA